MFSGQSKALLYFNPNSFKRTAKLEEVIRNKQIISYSSRFYEELKVFTWQSGKVQAKRGFNDDLVMSLAIGTWLYDASSDYSKDSKALNAAILGGFKVQRSEYQSESAKNNFSPIYRSNSSSSDKRIVKTSINSAINRSNIPKDMEWILK